MLLEKNHRKIHNIRLMTNNILVIGAVSLVFYTSNVWVLVRGLSP